MSVEHYELILEDEYTGNGDDIYFKPFEQTFHFVMFSMVYGMIYPNPATEKARLWAILVFNIIMLPANLLIANDIRLSYKEGDNDSIFRHAIVMGPFMTQYLIMVLMYINRVKAKAKLVEINVYFEVLNSRPLSHKIIALKWLKMSLFLEKSWSLTVLLASFSFPITAVCKNIVSNLFAEEPKIYFIHEVRSPFTENNLDTPFFYEFAFIFTCFASCMYFLNFTGYDGYFVQLILHLMMRMSLCGESLKDAFKIDNKIARRRAVREVIIEHTAICKFMDDINDMFKVWMSSILSAMVFHLCCCIFYLSKKSGVPDAEFMSATVAAVTYCYMVCSVGGLIQHQSENLADSFYQCGWERISDNYCRYLLCFMIARAQSSFQVQTISFQVVNHEMLVSMYKMAYSLFTFLKQTSQL